MHAVLLILISILILGYGVNSGIFKLRQSLSLLLSPATGLSLVIWSSYVLSIVGIPLKLGLVVEFVILFVLVIFSVLKVDSLPNSSPEITLNKKDYLYLSLTLLLAVIPKFIYYQYPSANSDPFFHSLKIKEIVLSNSLFFTDTSCGSSLISYPSGYHSIIATLVLISGERLPDIMKAMYILEIFKWVLYPTGTFFMAYSLVGRKDIAHMASFISIITPLYYNWQNFIILPATLNYYFFMILIGVYSLYERFSNTKLYALILFYIFPMVAIHLFQFYILSFFVLVLAMYSIILEKAVKNTVKIIIPVISGPLIYLLLTLPIRQFYSPIKIATTNMLNKTFLAYIDTPKAFFNSFVKPCFIDNSMYIPTLFTIIGILTMLYTGTKYKERLNIAFVSVAFFVAFIILNRLILHVFIPFISYIYTAGRALVLLTPTVPVFTAVGVINTIETVKNHFKCQSRVMRFLLFSVILVGLLSLMFSAEYSLFLQQSNALQHSLVGKNSLEAIEWIEFHVLPNTVFLNQGIIDSGEYITSLTKSKSIFNWINKETIHMGSLEIHPWNHTQLISQGISYVYVDTSKQVCEGELHNCVICSAIDVSEFIDRYRILYFNDGVWIFNLNDTKRDNNRLFKEINQYYYLTADTIYAGLPQFYKYLVYGFRIFAYDVISRTIKKDYPPALPIVQDHGTILFVPNETYDSLTIGIYTRKPRNLRIVVNDSERDIYIPEGYSEVTVKANIRKDELNILKIIPKDQNFCNKPDKWVYLRLIKLSRLDAQTANP